LRSLTGYLVGQNLLQGYSKVAVITYPDRICSAMAAALATSYIAKNNYRDGAAAVFTYEEGKEEEMAKKILEYNPDAVYIAYGGEQKLSYVTKITDQTLGALAKTGYRGVVVLHVRVWLATKQLSLLSEGVRNYLTSIREVRLFTADVPNRKFLFHKVGLVGGVKLEKFSEVSITEEHAKLLTISLPPPD
ncbi:MAG: hypothetical protein ACK4M3_04585, partial [Pyrobaculum sp.]